MKISDDLRQLSAAIDYLSKKRKDILDDLKARTSSGRYLHRTAQITKSSKSTS